MAAVFFNGQCHIRGELSRCCGKNPPG